MEVHFVSGQSDLSDKVSSGGSLLLRQSMVQNELCLILVDTGYFNFFLFFLCFFYKDGLKMEKNGLFW